MYKVLSDFYIILPNLLNLLNTSPKNLSPNPTSFIELFLNSSYRSQILMYNSMKIFGLISKYYKICMLIGSLLEPKPLKYLANASKFLVMHSQ